MCPKARAGSSTATAAIAIATTSVPRRCLPSWLPTLPLPLPAGESNQTAAIFVYSACYESRCGAVEPLGSMNFAMLGAWPPSRALDLDLLELAARLGRGDLDDGIAPVDQVDVADVVV